MPNRTAIAARKLDHLRLCCEEDVEYSETTTLLEDVRLVHRALPLFSPCDADLSAEFLGRRLSAPLIIGAMTGGADEARRINRALAGVAQEAGIGLALGSQRAMLEQPSLKATYEVRDIAPDCLLLGNIGVFQARGMSAAQVEDLMESVGADGVCLHLNPAMELFQREGDHDYGQALETVARLAEALGERLIVKETGNGISGEVGRALVKAGVRAIDVAGAGGSSWVKIENLRAETPVPEELRPFEEWGLPTAVCLADLAGANTTIIASGGLRNGLDMARSITLGADLCSCALPFLRALDTGGADGARWLARALGDGIRAAMTLTGCRTVAELKAHRPAITGRLAEWIKQRAF